LRSAFFCWGVFLVDWMRTEDAAFETGFAEAADLRVAPLRSSDW